MTLEEALQRLEDIVAQLENGQLPLDEALRLFEEGQKMVKWCEQDLDAKDLRIQQILADDALGPLAGS